MNIYDKFQTEKATNTFKNLYSYNACDAKKRYSLIHDEFVSLYGDKEYRIFSAPGRCEISGNHTDHNNGMVIASAVTCDTVCFATKRDDMQINITSYGYYKPFTIDLTDLSIKEKEYGTTQSLIRGVAKGLKDRGYDICGFDGYVHSTVLSGSGLSSSAAFEVLTIKVISSLCGYDMDPTERAIIAQYAENKYFGKPSGLMDQMASSIGSMVAIDFRDVQKPVVQKLSFDLNKSGYRIIITNTGGSHADLTDDYAKITNEMKIVADYFGKSVLREVDEHEFYDNLKILKDRLPHRAILRAIHFFDENNRVKLQIDAIIKGDVKSFLQSVNQSGESSYKYLQNIYADEKHQEPALALYMAKKLLKGDGATRVHGGGFAGTIISFVPEGGVNDFIGGMDSIFGMDSSVMYDIRHDGAVEEVF